MLLIAGISIGAPSCGVEATYDPCAVTCGASGVCPQLYYCGADNYCHLEDEVAFESCLPAVADAGSADARSADAGSADAATLDAGSADAGSADATLPDAAPPTCDLGTATNAAAVADPNLFALVIHFAGGASLPAGTYRVDYVDGCMKYASTLWWSIHGRGDGSVAWWLVGGAGADRLALLPGTFGLLPGTAGPTGDRDGFENFAECVAANLLVEPLLYTHAGGPLGLVAADIAFADNVSGEDGRNPRWRLTYLGSCEGLNR